MLVVRLHTGSASVLDLCVGLQMEIVRPGCRTLGSIKSSIDEFFADADRMKPLFPACAFTHLPGCLSCAQTSPTPYKPRHENMRPLHCYNPDEAWAATSVPRSPCCGKASRLRFCQSQICSMPPISTASGMEWVTVPNGF